jgi:diguanylate cyclase (GGDEF)-like protein
MRNPFPVARILHLDWRRGLLIGAVAFALTAAADYATSYELNLAALYLLVVLVVTWNCGWRWGTAFAITSLATQTFFGLYQGYPYSHAIYFGVAIANRALSYGLVVALAARLRHLYTREQATARVDHLTGVKNRLGAYEALDLEIARRARDAGPFCLAYIDCDNFKVVNDRFGHAKGDELLQTIARALMRTVRKTDTVGRIGGDEFVVILPLLDYDNAQAVTGKLHLALTHDGAIEGSAVTFSIGAGVFPTPPSSADEAMAFADQLMYRVKASNGNAVLVAESAGSQREAARQTPVTSPHLKQVADS